MNKAKVLFIDDDIVLGNIVTTALTEAGYTVHQQNSLTGVKAVVSEFGPDVIVMDVEIGTEDGIEVIPALYAIAPGIPVLVISSHIESSEVVRALRNGATNYLKKPLEMEELTAYIEHYAKAKSHSPVPRIKMASLELDLQDHTLYQGERKLKKLSRLEFALLLLLNERMGKTVGHNEINRLWEGATVEAHSLYNLIAKLRKTLAADTRIGLASMGGDGYMLKIEDAS